MKIKSIIIDDEPLARKGIKEYAGDVEFLECIGESSNPVEASALLNKHKVDLIFLDIQMPKLSGIDFLKTLKEPPMVIITTAYPEYALEGYELDVLDYLLKPISFERFLKAANKAREFFEMKRGIAPQKDRENYFFIKCDRTYEKIYFDDILFIQAMQNYVEIFTKERRYISHLTLKSVLSSLPEERFIKTHKSYIVSLDKVEAMQNNNLKINNHSIPIGKNHYKEVLGSITSKSLLRK